MLISLVAMEVQRVTVMVESTVVSVDGQSWGFCFKYPFFQDIRHQ